MGLNEDKKCDGCGADMRGAAIPEEHLHFYNSLPDGTLIHSAEEYAAVRDQIENETTHFSRVIGVEYQGGYDGVSEWRCPDCGRREGRCPDCGRREGRFSGKVLEDGETEVVR